MSEWIRARSASGTRGDVEIWMLPGGGVQMREADSWRPVLTFTAAEWAAFIAGAKAGEFDDLTAPAASPAAEPSMHLQAGLLRRLFRSRSS